MKRITIKIIACLVLIVALSLSASGSSCEEGPDLSDNRPGPGPVSITIALEYDEVSPRAPLLLSVKMRNIAQERHCYRMARGYANGIYNFSTIILDSKGNQVSSSTHFDKKLKETKSTKTEWLESRATFSQAMRLHQLFDLETPGLYSVQVNRALVRDGEKVYSNTLTFKILPKVSG